MIANNTREGSSRYTLLLWWVLLSPESCKRCTQIQRDQNNASQTLALFLGVEAEQIGVFDLGWFLKDGGWRGLAHVAPEMRHPEPLPKSHVKVGSGESEMRLKPTSIISIIAAKIIGKCMV